MNILNVEISQLKPYEKNQKKHEKKQINHVAKLIETYGFTQPLVIDKNNEIIIGHCRLEAAKKLELKEVPCLRLENLTEQQIKALRLADNKSNESEWLMDFVISDLKELNSNEIDITGFNADLIIEPDSKDDEVPEIPEEPKSKLGDIYQLGEHRLICGDSTDKKTIDLLMNATKADMVFTDPPYNINYSGIGENTSNKIMNDSMTPEAFDLFLKGFFERYNENCKQSAGWYVFHSSSTQHQFQKAIENVGWNVKCQIIWNKPATSMGWGDYRWKHEPMFYCGKEKTQFYGDRTNTTILNMPEDDKKALEWLKIQKEADKKGYSTIWTMKREPVGGYVHPTQKPVELITYALFNSSKSGDIVMDLFGGSGATLIACEKISRVCYMCELDTKYIDVIIKRFHEYNPEAEIKCLNRDFNVKEIWEK